MNLPSILKEIQDSKKLNISILCIIIGSFGLINYPTPTDTYPDYYMVEKPYLDTCSLTKLPHLDYTDPDTGNHYSETARNPLNWWLDCAGHKLFMGYDNLLPTIFSLAIIPMTYLVTVAVTQYRIAGLTASIFLTINPLFNQWANSVTYDQIWAFFLLLSVWLVFRSKYVSIPVYLLSIASKALAAFYLPMYLYSISKSKASRKAGIYFMIGVVAIAGIWIEYSTVGLGAKIAFHPENAVEGVERAFDIIVWDLPVIFGFVGIEFMFRKYSPSVQGKDIAFVWMAGIWIISALIYLFSGQFSFPYRFVPFAAFMSMYIGIVCTRVVLSFESIAKKRALKP